MLNKNVKIAKSQGVDLPIMHVYLAGRISGDRIGACLNWRQSIIGYYKNYKNKGSYPISFLCPLNSGEASSVDKQGLTSSIPPNLIYDKDLLSVRTADVIVANMDDFFEEGIKSPEEVTNMTITDTEGEVVVSQWKKIYNELYRKVKNRRENIGTVMEVAWALLLNKPVILIVPESRKEIFMKHPFTKRASAIVSSVEELTQEKYLQLLYKSIASAIY